MSQRERGLVRERPSHAIELTQALAIEAGSQGARAGAMAAAVVSSPELAASRRARVSPSPRQGSCNAIDMLLRRSSTPEEIAGPVAFLASDAGAPFRGRDRCRHRREIG